MSATCHVRVSMKGQKLCAVPSKVHYLHVGSKLGDPCFELVVVQADIREHTTQGTRGSVQPATEQER